MNDYPGSHQTGITYPMAILTYNNHLWLAHQGEDSMFMWIPLGNHGRCHQRYFRAGSTLRFMLLILKLAIEGRVFVAE